MNPFEKFQLGSLELANRIIMAPVKTGYGVPTAEITPRHEAFYRRRAEGGAGAIIPEPLFIDARGKEHPKQIGIFSDNQISGLKRLVNAIHDGGAAAIAHINHAGRAANPKASGRKPEAPSAIMCARTGVTAEEMTTERIKELTKSYAQACRRAVEAGFDAVEIQFGLGYLIAQFISPNTNKRTDDYGGSKENRYRFAKKVLDNVCQTVGKDYPIIARISATEQTENGLGFEDAIELGNFLKSNGIVALHVVSGSNCDSPPWYFQHMRLPAGKNLEWASKIKQLIDMPVIVAGRMGNPDDIRKALGDNLVDAIGLGRSLLADPDLPKKMRENRDSDVVQCGACLQGCMAKVKEDVGLGCIVNPEVGRESEVPSEKPARKKVVIVGGGPAGLQAAITATERGHEVVLYEKHEPGGQFNLSYLPPGKQMMERPLKTFLRKAQTYQVDFKFGQEATVDKIKAENPDTVIIATGAVPIIPPIPGLENALTGEDILTDKAKTGNKVLIIGGGMVGLECAEYLLNKKVDVTVVELLDDIARDMEAITRKLTIKHLKESKVRILTGTKVTRFENKEAFVETDNQEQSLGEFDNVIVAVGTKSISDLKEPLEKLSLDIKVIGDAGKPGQIYDAVKQGFDVALSI